MKYSFNEIKDVLKDRAFSIGQWVVEHSFFPNNKNYNKFVIVCNPRSGSNMLTSLLNSHPHVICFSEVFHQSMTTVDFHYPGYRKKSVDPKIVDLRNQDPEKFLVKQVFKKFPSGIRAVGFKVLHLQIFNSPPYYPVDKKNKKIDKIRLEAEQDFMKMNLKKWIKSHHDVNVIHVVRKNHLDSVISWIFALRDDSWGHNYKGGVGNKKRRKIILDIPSTVQLLEHFDHADIELKDFFSKNNYMRIYYEDLLSSERLKYLKQIQNFIQVKPRLLVSKTKKQLDANLKELIENYDELERVLRKTKYASFLYK